MIAGRYSLDREIGRGGMGAVWLGRDEVLGRQVALKQIGLLPGADSTDLARAEREARLSARLNHPHVVAVFDFVVDPETHARWLVMEYVAGPTMGQLIRSEGPLSPDDAAPLLWQAADALAAAHAAGIVHRDVKPSNILVDGNRRVKITDFGIARITADASLTQTGLITGSPAYLAPEVATGNRGDEAVDVWALGATIFYVLSGRPPYETTDNVLSTLYRIVNDEPPRLAGAAWMGPLLEATMVRDPDRRWSMAQVRDFLANPSRRNTPAPMPPTPVPEPDWGRADDADVTGTQVLGAVAPAATAPPTAPPVPPPAAPVAAPAPRPARRRPSPKVLLAGLGLVLALVLAGVLFAVLGDDDPSDADPSAKPSETPTSKSSAPAGPTAQGIETFIRDYVRTVGEDPDKSWQMLTPKFQVESGGIEKYRAFWGPATNGRVLSISTDPEDLAVSYQVRFDNFDNGPGPTVLDLAFEDGRYLIDGERTEGFTPSG
ncbi:MAG: serine/threonine-protein kinase [Aeromicrobium sp.]